MNSTASTGDERAATGVPGLDHILAGGLTRGRVHLLEGTPGTGKTTLALQFLLAGRDAGERGLYITLSESAEDLRATARSHGWDLDGIVVQEMLGEEALDPSLEQSILRPSELELGETVRAVMRVVRETAPARIAFDSLSEMRLLAQDPLRYRRQILALKQFFAHLGCTTLLLDDRSGVQGDLQLHSIAHGVIVLEQMARDYGGERRRLRVIKLRGSVFRGGWHDYAIATGGLVVYPRLIAAEHHREFLDVPVSTGVARLDAMLGGGLVPGTSLLVAGPSGAGKTTVVTQCVHAQLAAGRRGAMFLFDEGRDTMLARARSLGLDLAAALESGALTLRQIDPAEVSPGEFTALVRDAIERNGAGIIAIDSLDGYLQAMPGEGFLILQLHELLTYLNQQGCLTLLVLGRRGAQGEMAAVDVSYLSDAVILLSYRRSGPEIRRSLRIMKTRVLPHDFIARELNFVPGGGVNLGEPEENSPPDGRPGLHRDVPGMDGD